MNSSDSEYFESADEDFEHLTISNTKPTPAISKETSAKSQEIQVKEDASPNTLSAHEKVDKRKPRSKLGTKLGTKVLQQPLSTPANSILPLSVSTPDKSVSKDTNVENEPNLWEDEDWETSPTITYQEESQSQPKNDTWSSWGTWGVSSLLSTASSITTQVSQGLTTVLENGIGAPDPATLAKLDVAETTTETPDQPFGIGSFLSGVTHITKLVESTSTKVISGGLDTLETIGKKTMEVLQEGDPGFKKKRAFLKLEGNKPVLSHVLREAKDKAENANKILEQKHMAKRANYEMLFDDHEGLVHLEALEILSRQCDIKLETIFDSKSGHDLTEMQETMTQVKELCELNEDEDDLVDLDGFEEKLQSCVSEMNINISYDKLISTWAEAEGWFNNVNLNIISEMELHAQAIDTLAQLTAVSVEQFHKAAELLLIKQHRSTVDEADALVQLTVLLINLTSYVSKILSNKLNEKSSGCKNQENLNDFITNIYFEAANSCLYIKNAFQLLIPVLQVGAI